MQSLVSNVDTDPKRDARARYFQLLLVPQSYHRARSYLALDGFCGERDECFVGSRFCFSVHRLAGEP